MTVIVVGCQAEHKMTIAVIRKGEPMSDLISRLSELRSQYNCFDESERDAYHTLSEAIEALQAQKTGKWINCKFPLGECSECHAIVDIQNNEANYCPVCGSKNRGEL